MAARRVVLIVEDDRNFSRILEAKLHKNAYTAIIALDAAAGLAALLSRPVGVALLDGRLPDTDGLAALRLFRAAAPRTPFLFTTAYEKEYPRDQVIAAGAVEVLYKPFDLDRLMAEVARFAPGAAAAVEMEGAQAVAARERPFVERRSHPRVPISAKVAVTPASDGTVHFAIHGMTLDVSQGGLALVTGQPLSEGQEAYVECALTPHAGAALEARARVVRVEAVEGPSPLSFHRAAVRFIQPSPASLGLIEGIVAASPPN